MACCAGGASNTGGAVLRHYFDDGQIAALTPRLRPDSPAGLDYYPLLRPGAPMASKPGCLQFRLFCVESTSSWADDWKELMHC